MLDFGFYNMDCMEGMKQFPDKYFDLAIVDPPYGINIGSAAMGAGGGVAPHRNRSAKGVINKQTNAPDKDDAIIQVGGGCATGKGLAFPKAYKSFDDSTIPTKEYFSELDRIAKKQIIWGGNYFLDNLNATEGLIVWDKKRRGLDFADCEIAWTNIQQPCRIFEFMWNGMLQGDMKNKEYRIHPTQKPVALYKWLLTNYAKEGDKILDTHVGSASSLIACYDLGFDYVGFEIDEEYYRQAKQRLEEEMAQVRFDL